LFVCLNLSGLLAVEVMMAKVVVVAMCVCMLVAVLLVE
jgi:hypothetical protein